jgi:hypothetical protein
MLVMQTFRRHRPGSAGIAAETSAGRLTTLIRVSLSVGRTLSLVER